MEKIIETSKKETKDETEKIITVKSTQSIAESNLMLLPFVPVQNSNIKIYKRLWISNGIARGLTVKGSPDLGVPNIKDLDTLLALFRIMLKNSNYQYTYDKENNKVSGLNNEIHFTRRELAFEMGYKDYSGAIKNVIDKSLKRLNEATIYSELALRDAEQGEYINEFKGEESFKIIYDLKTYSYNRIKKRGDKIGNYETVRESTSLKIHEFFFRNICNNYFKIYDYKKYLKLNLSIAKKLFLILNQWSHGYEKFLTYQVLYDYLGLEINDEDESKAKKDIYYHNRQIKKSFAELVDINFIEDYNEDKRKAGINMIFNKKLLNKSKFLDQYTTDAEVVSKLKLLGLSYDDILKHYRLDNQDYVRALLRLYDYKLNNNELVDDMKFLMVGLQFENYDVSKFI